MNHKSSFDIRISKNISSISRQEWEAIFPHTCEGYAFYKTIDETMSAQFRSYYITLYDKSQIVCAAPCFIVDYPIDTTIEGPLKKISEKLKRFFPRLFTIRALICGCPAAEGKLGLKYPDHKEIAHSLVETMYTLSRAENARLIAFKDFSSEYFPFFRCVKDMRFHTMPSYPSAKLDIRFNSFEEYLSSLSRVTRKGLKKKFRQAEPAGIKMEVTSELGPHLDEAYALYLNTLKRSEVQFEKLSQEFFWDIAKNMPAETKYFLWYKDAKLIAFDLCLVSGNTLIDEYIGMDYAFAYRYHLYYVTFRDIVQWCIQNGIHAYETGALNYDPKKRLDFKFIPEYIYFRHISNPLNILFGILNALLKPGNFDKTLQSLPTIE